MKDRRSGFRMSERTGGWGVVGKDMEVVGKNRGLGGGQRGKAPLDVPPYEDTSGTITFTRAQYRAPARRDLIRRPIVVKSPPARNI